MAGAVRSTLSHSRSQIHFVLGVTLEELRELDEAESSLRQSLRLKDTSVARQALAVVMMEKGSFEDAKKVHLHGPT